jgi:hypothetical protein
LEIDLVVVGVLERDLVVVGLKETLVEGLGETVGRGVEGMDWHLFPKEEILSRM